MAEVTYDGVGNPIIDPNIVGAEANIAPGPWISTNGTNPKEAELGATGIPVTDPNITGAEVNYGATAGPPVNNGG